MPAAASIRCWGAAMVEPLLSTDRLIKRFGGLVATDAVSIDIRPGEIHALIGPNGAGKTTLVSQLTGNLKPDAGRIHFAGRDVTHLPTHARVRLGLARSFQITAVLREFTTLDNVALAVQAHAGHSFRFLADARRDQDLRRPARQRLADVGLEARADALAATLSHGEQRQLEIAMALAGDPSLLLLDEPMAGMGVEESQRMIAFLRGLKGKRAMLLIEHDMDAVFQLADRVTVLVYGRAIASGTPAEIRANPDVRQAYLGDDTPSSPVIRGRWPEGPEGESDAKNS
jgi:branched-chain amino acid transport system ATP-binding protein